MNTDRIAEIRARLAAATRGPWEATYEEADQWTSITGRGGPLGNGGWTVCPEVATCEGRPGPDADLIANAPTDLADLLDERERLLAVVISADSLLSLIYYREPTGLSWQTRRDADALLVDLRAATTGEAGQ